ncbi:unannotated protein [freshwater metagenome]|uniref:Unannotated protein n=1 Tax=freshwater metagenome TaxID=449393 RepID=A0A6J6JUU9_9ZZZZ
MSQHLPQRLVLDFADHVPQGVDDATGSHVGDAFLWAKPAHLRITDQISANVANTRNERLHRFAYHHLSQLSNRRALHVVTAANCENQAVSRNGGVVSVQDQICSRVVRVLVHSVGPVPVLASGEADVEGLGGDNFGHQRPPSVSATVSNTG